MGYDWDFTALAPYTTALLTGLLVTIQISIISIAAGTILGFALGPLLRTPLLPLRWLLLILVDVVRSTPTLILIVSANYALPTMLGRPTLDPFLVACVVLSLNLAVFVADVVRGAIGLVPATEVDAARAIGLSDCDVLARIKFPHVIDISLPTLTLLYIAIAKHSALASVISVYDLTHTANLIITEKMRTLEVYSVVTGLYVLVILPLTLLSRRIEGTRRPARLDA